MKWTFSILATLLLAFCLPGFAQSDTTPNTSTNNSSQHSSAMDQSNGNNGSQSGMSNQSGNQENSAGMHHHANQQSLEGCIVKEETEYYLIPENGGNRVHLNNSDNVAKHEGHHVRVYGQEQGSGNTAENHGSANTSTNNAESDNHNMGNTGNEFLVDKIQMISTKCPQGSNSGNMHQH